MAEMERQRHLMMMQESEWAKGQEEIMRQQEAMRAQFEKASLEHEAKNWQN